MESKSRSKRSSKNSLSSGKKSGVYSTRLEALAYLLGCWRCSRLENSYVAQLFIHGASKIVEQSTVWASARDEDSL